MGENTAALKDMAAQLAAKLRVQGGGGMEEWSKLHRKLAQVAAAAGGDNPTTAVQALLNVAKDASSSQAFMRALDEMVRVSKANLKSLVSLVAHELDMTPLGDSEPVQMVDEHGDFCEENVDGIINCSAELSAPNAPYAVVSIVGAQSSGKSFLMNRLFGTRFAEMDASLGRSRTSKGIMISRCIGPSLLLMDVEGFDGRERGQHKLFENQAALFALAVSDLMLVNISIQDIGRDQGGSIQLFRTIFKERVKLNSAGITKIVVVVRFYDGETPLDILRKDVLLTLEKSWKSVNEETVKFTDYIEVKIVGLPDKKAPEFPKEVKSLRKLLSNNTKSKVESPSFSYSSRIFWEKIKKNKDLDIPSHQEALATLFCQQKVKDALKSLDSKKDYKQLQNEESPRGFIEISQKLKRELKAEYDWKTKNYDNVIRDRERRCLEEELNKIFASYSRELVRNVKEDTLENLKGEFYRNTLEMKEAQIDSYAKQIVDECMDTFMSSFEDLKVFDSVYINTQGGQLKNKMQSYTVNHSVTMKAERAKKERQRRKTLVTQAALMAVSVATNGAIHFTDIS